MIAHVHDTFSAFADHLVNSLPAVQSDYRLSQSLVGFERPKRSVNLLLKTLLGGNRREYNKYLEKSPLSAVSF